MDERSESECPKGVESRPLQSLQGHSPVVKTAPFLSLLNKFLIFVK